MDNKIKEIAKFFIINKMYEIMYDNNEIPNISFHFKEQEAIDLINNIINENIECSFNKLCKIYDGINNVNYNNPVIEVNNYKLFFLLLNDLTISLYDIYKNKTNLKNDDSILYFQSLLKYIWLRMTPDDFKNPELFLLKNVKMLKNCTFDEYYNKNGLLIELDDNYRVYYNNNLASPFDEENKAIEFFIGSRYLETYYLPVVRYGIYQKDNKTICEIGSIQNKYLKDNIYLDIINDYRKKLNKGVPGELKVGVEPKKLLSLLLFIKLLQENGIYNISIPSLYVLDYDFHSIWEQNEINIFKSKWSNYLINLYPDEYEKELEEFNKKINKVDLICKTKTTDFIKLFERLMYHIPDIDIIEYPNELSSYMRIKLPENNSTEKIIQKIIK